MSISTTLRYCCFNAVVGLCALLGTFADEARAVVINWTPIGNPSNAADPKSGYGAVGDIYNIGTYDVTNSQYVEFLNAKDPTGANTLGLYDSHMGSDDNVWGHQLHVGQRQWQQVQHHIGPRQPACELGQLVRRNSLCQLVK